MMKEASSSVPLELAVHAALGVCHHSFASAQVATGPQNLSARTAHVDLHRRNRNRNRSRIAAARHVVPETAPSRFALEAVALKRKRKHATQAQSAFFSSDVTMRRKLRQLRVNIPTTIIKHFTVQSAHEILIQLHARSLQRGICITPNTHL